jgi:hypothetical protein
MLPLLAHFPMGLYVNPLILHWFVGIPKQERTTNSCLKTNRAQEHEITNTVYKGFNREISPFFCTVVDSLTTSLSKAKSPNSIIPVE